MKLMSQVRRLYLQEYARNLGKFPGGCEAHTFHCCNKAFNLLASCLLPIPPAAIPSSAVARQNNGGESRSQADESAAENIVAGKPRAKQRYPRAIGWEFWEESDPSSEAGEQNPGTMIIGSTAFSASFNEAAPGQHCR
ncbi:MAG: hypothetical protein IPF44_07010 [Betaproteobacteria bacterium]|nr:hypothetical protein [Betaproteobacteria bacterium]